jgi:hypothetical protein
MERSDPRVLAVAFIPAGRCSSGQGEGWSLACDHPGGRYFLGQTKQWQFAATTDSQVIVQPNFEVTFLRRENDSDSCRARHDGPIATLRLVAN